jgi:ankyrin repeat protein
MAAALCGREEIARYLIEKGANVNARNKTGLTPLHFAADQSYPEPSIVRMLLERGADVEARDSVGLTPLARAERNGNRLLVDSLRRTIALRVRKDGAGLRQKALSRSAAGEDYAG